MRHNYTIAKYVKVSRVAKAGERPSSPAPHEAKYALYQAEQVMVIKHFRHVLRRQVQRLVVRQPRFGTYPYLYELRGGDELRS